MRFSPSKPEFNSPWDCSVIDKIKRKMMNLKLSQVLAIEKTAKSRGETAFTKAHHTLEKKEPLSGISRTYEPLNEDGETLPSESTKVQVKVEDQVKIVQAELSNLLDITAQKDYANCVASADIVVDGQVLAEKVPVTYLLVLEKKLVDLFTFVSKLPLLDPSVDWEYDPNSGVYKSETLKTNRTKKVPRVLVKAPATDKHQADTEVWHEDIIVGTWNTIRFSGAETSDYVNGLKDKVEALQKAVKIAREEANTTDAPQQNVGSALMDFIFA
jgi:hypothetical protein